MKQVTIKNNCIALTVLDYGAIIQKIEVLNKHNEPTNIVVGFEDPADYLNDNVFLGACVGRYAGRISGGQFKLMGKTYKLKHLNGVHLHGGELGFGKKYWSIDKVDQSSEPAVRLSYKSPAMEEGYPGELAVTVEYKLVKNALHIIHRATTTETTVVNLTNHSYFRLDNENTIDHYLMQLKCSNIVETYENLLPTGTIVPVSGTDYDFNSQRQIGAISLDTPYILDTHSAHQASVYSPLSGIGIKLHTNQPSIVVYRPPNFGALCFETQNYPDAPNHPNFPSAVLHPGETYNNTAFFEFDLVT